MTGIDYIVVGQGLAGTLICHELEKNGRTFVVYDHGSERTSSSVAAGIINPITGRRFVKSWMFDELLPEVKKTYGELSRKLECSLLHKSNIIRTLPDQKTENDWYIKASNPEYTRYIVDPDVFPSLPPALNLGGMRLAEIQGYRMNMPLLVSRYREYLLGKDLLISKPFFESEVEHGNASVQYGGHRAQYIIYCTGASMAVSELLDRSFFSLSKGEILLLDVPFFELGKMVKKKHFVVPLERNRYWFGSLNRWQFEDDSPTSEGYDTLSNSARQMINVPFKVLSHTAAVRPTIRDRRPVMGAIGFRQYIFNGLGTKGASLGPFWSKKLIKHIEQDLPLPQEVEISRFR